MTVSYSNFQKISDEIAWLLEGSRGKGALRKEGIAISPFDLNRVISLFAALGDPADSEVRGYYSCITLLQKAFESTKGLEIFNRSDFKDYALLIARVAESLCENDENNDTVSTQAQGNTPYTHVSKYPLLRMVADPGDVRLLEVFEPLKILAVLAAIRIAEVAQNDGRPESGELGERRGENSVAGPDILPDIENLRKSIINAVHAVRLHFGVNSHTTKTIFTDEQLEHLDRLLNVSFSVPELYLSLVHTNEKYTQLPWRDLVNPILKLAPVFRHTSVSTPGESSQESHPIFSGFAAVEAGLDDGVFFVPVGNAAKSCIADTALDLSMPKEVAAAETIVNDRWLSAEDDYERLIGIQYSPPAGISAEEAKALVPRLMRRSEGKLRRALSIHEASKVLFNEAERHWLAEGLTRQCNTGGEFRGELLVMLSICTAQSLPSLLKLPFGFDHVGLDEQGNFRVDVIMPESAASPSGAMIDIVRPTSTTIVLQLPDFVVKKVKRFKKGKRSAGNVAEWLELADHEAHELYLSSVERLRKRYGRRFHSDRIESQLRYFMSLKLEDIALVDALFGHGERAIPIQRFYRWMEVDYLQEQYANLAHLYFNPQYKMQ